VSSAEVAGILKRETSVRDVILAATAADVAVVGIGSVNQRRDATILRSGYISEGEQLMYARKGRGRRHSRLFPQCRRGMR
jgi:lsr operon transcriptional repressor